MSASTQATWPEWRDIETAPRDGTRILVGKRGTDWIDIAAYAQGSWRELFSGRTTFHKPDVWLPPPPVSP